MPFIVIDTTNDYNPINKRQFATEAEVEAAATQDCRPIHGWFFPPRRCSRSSKLR
jgi:hypothetical protein